jgi:4-carboxymuconolactone decarboxylase
MTDDSERARRGEENFAKVLSAEMTAPPTTPFTKAARDFVFSEVWGRPGLDQRSRTWITLACVCAARAPMPIRIYLNAALDGDQVTEAELREFILQFAAYQGFPKAAEVEIALNEVLAQRAAK